jgi:Rha family phage regulatory protein
MNELLKVEFDEKLGYFVSSRTIADGLGKRHTHVLNTLDEILTNRNVGSLIVLSKYKDKKGEWRKEYKLTKDGFTLYMFHVQGFTDFKMAYINRFNEMESFIKEAHTKLKEITINGKFDWMIKRMRDRIDKAEYIENQIAYLFNLLKEEYTKIMLDSECKTKSAATFFHDFKTPEKYDASKEPLPVIVELEIEKENLDKINELGLDKNKVLEDIVKNKTLENTIKVLEQKKLKDK